MARRLRTRNTRLEALFQEAGWTWVQVAANFRIVAAESGATEHLKVTRDHVAQWIYGSRPKAQRARILCETLSRRLGRPVTLSEAGLQPADDAAPTSSAWDIDPLTALADLGDRNMEMKRRQLLYSAAGAALPSDSWWTEIHDRAQRRASLSRLVVTPADVEGVREMMSLFSRRDQRYGGRAGRATLATYLSTEVTPLLAGRFPSEELRRELFSTAAELTYLAAWMAFDASHHAVAQQDFDLALNLAAQAGDAPLAGHILRAKAHQACDLGHPSLGLDYASASMEQRRYTLAAPREKALLGVIHARSLAAAGHKQDARTALLRAESDLDQAKPEDEPDRVFFFSQAALAHETARTLSLLGDLKEAERAFHLSVSTRKAQPFARTHSVTLGYLGDVQLRTGQLEAACATWKEALNAMEGVQSGRARDTVVRMRRSLSPVIRRGGHAAAELDAHAREVLRRVG